MSSLRTLFAAATAMAALPAAVEAAVVVHIDETVPVTVGGQIGQLVVANPSIADVSLTDRRHIMILGRTYGETSVIALDPTGRRIFESTINVAPASAGRVSLYRGVELYNYACSPRCERTPMPGESMPVYQSAAGPYAEYPGRAKSAAGNGGSQ